MTIRVTALGGTDWSDGEILYAADLNNTFTANNGSGNIDLHILHYDSSTQGTWAITAVNSTITRYSISNTGAAADGDNMSFKVNLVEGTYRLIVVHQRTTASGVIDFDIDGTEVASVDFYGSASDQIVSSTGSIAVTANGVVDFRIRVDGKNASSSNYHCVINKVYLVRTA